MSNLFQSLSQLNKILDLLVILSFFTFQTIAYLVDCYDGNIKKNTITGIVHSIAPASSASFSLLPPQNASGNFVKVVQRVPVKITFKTPKNMLGRIVPGLSVYVSIETKP